ncbi:MAG TPA: tryptophan--tRNA ligase [Candidatus Paceibacterota bacterium]|nr:tryptophan--tRNA ligase [Candidatus Paceibacterota bacterium]
MSHKILLSGVKPTGAAHIGNYFGAMKQMVDLQNSGNYQCLFFLADYHALNFIQNKEEMKKLTLELALDYLAIGLDPKKSIIFKQSDISAHTELAWIFNTIVTMPYLMRAHAFKDAEAKDKEINVGTFDYPVLMAADILLYGADVVPVGQDQKQHVEYARDLALKFNHIFGPKNVEEYSDLVFKLPDSLILENVAIVPGVDGRKMSKSYGNTIPLFATREEITKAVMSIVTDSGKPEDGGKPMNVYNIHRLFKSEEKLAELYDMNKGKYKALKDALVEDIDAFIKPLRERRAELAKNPKKVMKILEKGAKQARKIADRKMIEAKKAIGVL